MPRYKDENGYQFDQIQEAILDTITLNNATVLNSTRSFYEEVAGKAANIDTNLRKSAILEAKVSFQVQGICIDAQVYDSALKSVLPELQEKSGCRLVIGEKDYWKGQMRMLTGKIWAVSAMAGDTDNEYFFAQYGAPKGSGLMFARGNHVVIPELQSFRLEMVTAGMVSTIGAGKSIRLSSQLKGFLRRPVQ